MSERYLFQPWKEVFHNWVEYRNMIYDYFVDFSEFKNEKFMRRESLAFGYAPPYGVENFWGVGFGFKGFPSEWNAADFFRFRYGIKPHSLNVTKSFLKNIFREYKFEKCIKIFVGKKANDDRLVDSKFLVSNIVKKLHISDIPYDVVEIDKFIPTSQIIPPISGGNVSLKGGTIGAIVQSNNGLGENLLLSCAHVFHDFINPKSSDIIHPAKFEMSKGPQQIIGTLKEFKLNLSNDNFIDAATAEINSNYDYKKTDFNGARDPTIFEPVEKVGAVTGKTKGVACSGLIKVSNFSYPFGSCNFHDVFVVDSIITEWPPSNFCEPGDSGSVITSQSDNKVLGLIFGRSPKHGNKAICCTATAIERELNVRF